MSADDALRETLAWALCGYFNDSCDPLTLGAYRDAAEAAVLPLIAAHEAALLRDVLDPQHKRERDLLRAMLLDGADRFSSPEHKGNRHAWPEHAAMLRRLSAALAATEAPTCSACGAPDAVCVETDGGCCDACRATGGCSHPTEAGQ